MKAPQQALSYVVFTAAAYTATRAIWILPDGALLTVSALARSVYEKRAK